MFSLIITLIALALVVILILATLYFGGSAFGRGAARASAETVINQSVQIGAAADLAIAQGRLLPAGQRVTMPADLLKSIPVPPSSAYESGTPAASDWEYYLPGQTSHFGLKLKVKKTVCMEVNKSQGFIGIPAAWDGTSQLQCFGPGSDGGYTYIYEPPSRTPQQHDDAVDKAVEDAKPEVPTVKPGYPRECPDGSKIESGVCAAGSSAPPPSKAEGFWVITAIASPYSSDLQSQGFSETCPAGGIDPTSAAATPAPSMSGESFSADGLVELEWRLAPDFDSGFSGDLERTWCIPAKAADVPEGIVFSTEPNYGDVINVSQTVLPSSPGVDSAAWSTATNSVATVTSNGVSWSMVASVFSADTENSTNGDMLTMAGRKVAIGKTATPTATHFINSPTATIGGTSYTNRSGTITFDPPSPPCIPDTKNAAQGTGGRVVQVRTIGRTSAILKEDGSVWMTGAGYDGQFGNCSYDGAAKWTRVSTNVRSIGDGRFKFYLIKNDGSVWSSGSFENYSGGPNRYYEETIKFVRIVDSDAVYAASGSYSDMFYLKSDGTLWFIGFNMFGQAGSGMGNEEHATWHMVDSNVASFEATGDGAVYVKRDNTLWITGNMTQTHLGASSPTLPNGIRTTPGGVPLKLADGVAQGTRAGSVIAYVKTDGTVWAAGRDNTGCGMFGNGTGTSARNLSSFTRIATTLGPVSRVSWTADGMTLLGANGTLYATGCNSYGTMGNGTRTGKSAFTPVASNIAQADAGYVQFLLLNDGTLWVSGMNDEGQAGTGNYDDTTVFVQSTY